MLVSTFELLIKPQIPPEFDPKGLGRTVIQGYFLTISNLNSFNAALTLTFTATTPSINLDELITLLDRFGNNETGDLVPTSDPRKFTFRLVIRAHDTVLFILQPDVTKPDLITAANTELRGYVEVSLSNRVVFPVPTPVPFDIPSSPVPLPELMPSVRSANSPQELMSSNPEESITVFNPSRGDFLLTPELRGTFVPRDLTAPNLDFDQIAYSLPTANGGSRFQLTR